jgi:RNA binding exosome subunit
MSCSDVTQALRYYGNCKCNFETFSFRYITPDELKSVLENLGEKFSDEEVQDMMKEADTDHDGRINYDG